MLVGGLVGGILSLTVGGVRRKAKGNFKYNMGDTIKSAVLGADEVHGYKEMPQTPFIEGEITLTPDMVETDITSLRNAEVFLEVAGRTYVLHSAWFASEGDVETEEGNMAVKFEGLSMERV